MSVLVCGGAGYVGSHTVKELIKENKDVVVVDNLSTGHIEAVDKNAKFYHADIRDKAVLAKIFAENKIEGVMHFAASSLVGESMSNPLVYFNNNVYGMQVLLECMEEFAVEKIVFSSTCAVYGTPKSLPVSEDSETVPESSYGESKLIMEKMMKWVSMAHNIRYVSLRYFNASGAAFDGSIGEDHTPETHLIPLVLQTALGKRDNINVFGSDYDTPDGTAIRDYIHVIDLASAHIKALAYIDAGNQSEILNLGSGTGYSVKEIIDVAQKITGREINKTFVARRPGDPAQLVAAAGKAKSILGWETRYDINDIMQTAWLWHKTNTDGFKGRHVNG